MDTYNRGVLFTRLSKEISRAAEEYKLNHDQSGKLSGLGRNAISYQISFEQNPVDPFYVNRANQAGSTFEDYVASLGLDVEWKNGFPVISKSQVPSNGDLTPAINYLKAAKAALPQGDELTIGQIVRQLESIELRRTLPADKGICNNCDCVHTKGTIHCPECGEDFTR